MLRVGIAVGGVLVLAVGVLIGFDWADTDVDEVGLRYGGGPIEDVAYKGLISPGATNEFVGFRDDVYRYPVAQQTYLVSAENAADAPAIVVVTKDGVRLEVSGRLYFTLNSSEDTLREFHERIGMASGAYVNDGREGFDRVMDTYVLPQLDRALDVNILAYDWLDIRSDPTIRPAFESAVGAELHSLVRSSTGGEYFCGAGYVPGGECYELSFGVTRLKPMNPDLSTFTEEREKLEAEIANRREELEAELADERRRLKAELRQQRVRNQRAAEELDAIRDQVEVLGVDGYNDKVRNDLLREAIASGNADVDINVFR